MPAEDQSKPADDIPVTAELLATAEELVAGLKFELPDGDKRVRVIVVPRPFGFSG